MPVSSSAARPPTQAPDTTSRDEDGRRPSYPRDSAATAARILEAARAEFCEHGLSGARIDRIAQAADVNKRMLYHYYGNKDGLYRAALVDAYREIRAGERSLELDRYPPEEAMERLVRFTFRHFLDKPWFVRILTVENLNQARFLSTVDDIRELHSPLVAEIQRILARGVAQGLFRAGVDPVQLYITIAGLGYFYVGNIRTLSVIFDRDLGEPALTDARADHIVDVVRGYLRPVPGQGSA